MLEFALTYPGWTTFISVALGIFAWQAVANVCHTINMALAHRAMNRFSDAIKNREGRD